MGGSAKLPAHVSSDEAIAQMEDKVKQKQIAEEEKKKHKEEREMKRLTKQKEKAKKSKKANKKGTTKKTQSACLVDGEDEVQKKDATKETWSADLDDNDVKCPVCCNDDPYEKWVCCDIYDIWYHTGCVGISKNECGQLKDMDWFCSDCIEY